MENQTPSDFLAELYDEAMSIVGVNGAIMSGVSESEQELLTKIIRY